MNCCLAWAFCAPSIRASTQFSSYSDETAVSISMRSAPFTLDDSHSLIHKVRGTWGQIEVTSHLCVSLRGPDRLILLIIRGPVAMYNGGLYAVFGKDESLPKRNLLILSQLSYLMLARGYSNFLEKQGWDSF